MDTKLILIEEEEYIRRYKLEDGKEITIQLNDCGEWIKVTDSDGKEIGRIDFSLTEYEDHDEYKITWMYMNIIDPSYKRKGIGRACLQFFKECGFGPPTASDHDGIRKEDGSHLTQDAPAFIDQMRKEGLVVTLKYES